MRNRRFTRISGIVTDIDGEPLIGASIIIANTNIGTITDINGFYSIDVPLDQNRIMVSYTGFSDQSYYIRSPRQDVTLQAGQLLDEIVVTGYGGKTTRSIKQKKEFSYGIEESKIHKGTFQFELELPQKTTLLSQEEDKEISLRQISLLGNIQHITIPKLSKYAFVNCSIENWAQHNLLSGNMNIYVEGAYIGKSSLQTETIDDKLKFSLGIDRNVIVARERVYYKNGKRLLNRKKDKEYSYRTTIRNLKETSLTIIVKDQIPVSTEKRIKVSETDISDGFLLNSKTGIGQWTKTIDSNSTIILDLGYKISH